MSTELATRGQAYMTPSTTGIDTQTALPYVIFASKKADKWDDYAGQIRGLQESNPVLVNGGKYTKQLPLRFNLVEYTQLWVEREQGREALSVSRVRPAEFGGPLVEEIHAAALVHAADGAIIPASITFKKALCKGASKAAMELDDVSGKKPEKFSDWVSRSDDHRAAAGITLPFARFTVTLTTNMRPAKYNGNPYPESNATLTPTSVGDWNKLQGFLTDEGFDKLDAVVALYRRRVSELLELESKSA